SDALAHGLARLTGEPITVQHISEGLEAWAKAIVGTDWPHAGDRREQALRNVGLMAQQIVECNVMGSPALGLCNVAAGRLHAYWHLALKVWALAAARLLVHRDGRAP